MPQRSALSVYGRALRSALPGGPKPTGQAPTGSITVSRRADASSVAVFDDVIDAPVRNVVPPAYLHTIGFHASLELMTDPGLGLPVLGMVHVRNSFTQLRPVLVGETVEAEVRLSAPRARHNGTEVDLLTTGRVDGEEVFSEASTYLAKGKKIPGAREAEPAPRLEMPTDLQPTAIWRLPRSIGPAFARVSGDHNPIHLNVLAAKAFGFPATIAHGMYSAARALAAAGVRWDSYQWDVQFASPLVLPGTVGFAVYDKGEDSFAEAVFSLRNDKPHVLSRVSRR